MKHLLFLVCACVMGLSAQASVSVVGNLSRIANVKPGDSFEGVIVLKNIGQQAEDVRLSQTDYLFRADGSNEYGEAGKTPRSNAAWIVVSPSRLKLASGESQPVHYKGKVPMDPKLRGTFWSVIMVEPNTTPAITSEGKPQQVAVGLATTIRYAIQIITEIGQNGTRSLEVQDKRIVKSAGKRVLHLDIGNDGESMLTPMVTVELFDKNGASNGRFDARRARIFPHCSIRAEVDLSDVPPGKYTAMVLLDSGSTQVMGAQYELEIAP